MTGTCPASPALVGGELHFLPFISMTRSGLKLTFSPPYLTVLLNYAVSPTPAGILSQAFIESIKPY